MAPTPKQSSTTPAAVEEEPPSNAELCKALYASCATHAEGHLFYQEELETLGVVPKGDLATLAGCLNTLIRQGLFKLMTGKEGRSCWKVVKKEDAEKYRSLTTEEAIVYAYVEAAGRDGMWTKTGRARTNLHQGVFVRALKSLETKGRIKQVTNSKSAQKTYILSHLQPSEDITGGPFYTDGNLDDEFVHHMAGWIERYVVGRTWYVGDAAKGKREAKGAPAKSRAEAESARDQALNASGGAKGTRAPVKRLAGVPLPMPPGYTGYPTTAEVTRALNESGLSTVRMKEPEVRQLLDLLRWDDRVQRAPSGKGWRGVRPRDALATVKLEDGTLEEVGDGKAGSGLAYAPCGRCPVAGLCRDGGPVSASTCPYFQEWLQL